MRKLNWLEQTIIDKYIEARMSSFMNILFFLLLGYVMSIQLLLLDQVMKYAVLVTIAFFIIIIYLFITLFQIKKLRIKRYL